MEYLGGVPDQERHVVVGMTGREYQALGMLVDSMWRRRGLEGLEGLPVSRQDVAEFLELACRIIEERGEA